MPTLLVVDDEENVRYSFRYVFEEDGVRVLSAGTAAEGLQLLRDEHPDVVVLDLQLPDRSGLEVFDEIREADPKRPVIFITAHGTTDTAIQAMKNGAFDYLVKPLDLERLSQLLNRAFEAARLMSVPPLLPVEEQADRIVGRSTIMQEMCKAIGRMAPQDVNVLIEGESGTGKELVARALYHHSRRADKPFLAINCAAIPETLLESELFGHEQGTFTGASRRRIGKFEQCNGGTLLLDEIGDMAPALQAKMLRVLQEQRFERLGGNETVETHVRVLAATNHDLEKAVAEGAFRKDLYYRLKVATIRVPPLREHLDDVAELAHYFLFRFNSELGRDLRGLTPEALELLVSYSWPGNVRELQSALKQAMLQASGHILAAEFLPNFVRGQAAPQTPAVPKELDFYALTESLLKSGAKDLHNRAMEAMERVLLPQVLRFTEVHQAQESELLGISSNTMRKNLRHLGFAVGKVFTDHGGKDETDESGEAMP
jgi:two-component system nitrogen regulation response regulator GlnG